MKVETKHICYVVQDVGVHHPISHHRQKLIWYPERGMTFFDCIGYKPYIQSIVTENPYIISCYDYRDVRVWQKTRWETPFIQTYGSDIGNIVNTLLGWTKTISATPLDGGIELGKLKRKIEDQWGMADATYHRKRIARSSKI